MDQRERARRAFASRAWQDAYDGFSACDDLEAADFDALGECAHWLGRADEVIANYTEAFRLHCEAHAYGEASYSAFMLAVYYRIAGEPAHADGWMSRAQRSLVDAGEGSHHGYPMFLQVAGLMDSAPAEAMEAALRMQEIGKRFGDDTLSALGLLLEGRINIKQARVAEGMRLLDEAMVAALSDRLAPMWTGAIYCGLLDACHELADLQRATEWTYATTKWCSPLPVASLYPGICRVHRAELLHVRGNWDEAEAEALGACRDMEGIDVFVVADGFYEIGEIRRRRNDLAGAEEAYNRAHDLGRDPQPGLARLRLAQGKAAAALSSIAVALAGAGPNRLARAPMLAAQVDIALGVGNVALARAAADELIEIAVDYDSKGLRARARTADGAVDLAERQPVAALGTLRLALGLWHELDAPYDAAQTRVLLADAYSALDDHDAAARERTAADAAFARLGVRTAAPSGAPKTPLSEREIEVLRLVATGMTNRDVAGALFLSEKTVARHVANIFTKLDLSSRAAATAYAFSHGLVAH